MSKNPKEKVQAKFHHFAITNRHKEGIVFFRKLLKNKDHRKDSRAWLNLAFLLYHQALKSYWKKNVSVFVKKNTLKQLHEAEKILKGIIYPHKTSSNEEVIFNAKIFLAQIYASMSKPEAVKIAKENFREKPMAISANRLADVYMRLGNKKLAESWYKKYENLALKEKVPSFLVSTDMAIFYKQIHKNELAQRYLKKALKSIPHSKEGKSILSILRSNFDI